MKRLLVLLGVLGILAGCAGKAVIQPEPPITDKPVQEGAFIMAVKEGYIFVSGGGEGAINLTFPEADQLSAGQRVKVETKGPIFETSPASGTAKQVEILPDYKPDGATLTESEAVRKVIEQETLAYFNFNIIKDVHYDEGKWIFEISDGNTVEVEDR